MAVKYSQINELLGIMLRHMGRPQYAALVRDIKRSQAYIRNQSFRETMDRMERHMLTGRPKPSKEEPSKELPSTGTPSRGLPSRGLPSRGFPSKGGNS